MALSNTQIQKAKSSHKNFRLYDEKGLYLEVTPAGGKLWRLKYRFGGKEKRLALGAYPAISLKDAREARDNARALLANRVDPGEHKKTQRAAQNTHTEDTFEAIARDWHAGKSRKKTEDPSPTTEDKNASFNPSNRLGIESFMASISKFDREIRIPTKVKNIPSDVSVLGAMAANWAKKPWRLPMPNNASKKTTEINETATNWIGSRERDVRSISIIYFQIPHTQRYLYRSRADAIKTAESIFLSLESSYQDIQPSF